ncbi:hypothetical protein LMG11579_1595 [Bifidobacterium adolescentis]|uniref:SpaA isopeptide-forming pilin-related protein n=1 Tax=Bifidobacterium adolescentis TaxID=1680 RepID=UPI000A2651C2|nr:SpaA isopeptide-forming pilin-related protein [Bifidobacterium adolescentis]OSH00719.1 hypothetical protein LMG11579_1595 [Bifidobacterium adolescentis]
MGFGGQYRPAPGSSTLEVRGNSTDNAINWVGGAQAWGNAGWVGQIKTSEPSYTANIAGDSTTVYGGSSNDILGASYGSQNTNKKKYDQRNSVYVPSDTNGTVNWNQNDDQIGSTGETFDGFGSYIKTLSGNLSNLSKQQSDSVYVTNAKTTHNNEDYTNLVRAKFDGTYSFTINNVHEKIIEFEGNGKSSMQVFNLPASTLNDSSSSSYSGVSFSFKNIPDTSSVVINVTGENVDFHNGWRFWWTDTNGTTSELGGSYTDNAYAKRAQQIMWNFADASNVVIRGGQGSGSTTRDGSNSTVEGNDGVWAGSFPMQTYDDPAAGMLGSILVPNGSFESHVSTNGRVWVGGSFAMYNPDEVGNTYNGTFYPFLNYERSHSASALDMDQERHNLPWNGSYSTSCAAIAWDKVDDTAEHKALGGTSWTVYGKKEDAVTSKNALATIADGGWNDDADAEGSFQLGNLAKNGTYFLKESGTVEGYAQNTNIYQINTGDTTDAAKNIVRVFNSNGIEITGDTDKLLTGGKIVNKKTGSSITWQKVDGTDGDTLLAGSTWELSKMNGDTAEKTWTVTDDQSGTEVKSITITDASGKPVTSVSFTDTTSQTFIATAYDQNGNAISGAKLSWSSGDNTVASVDQNGTVTPTGSGHTTITVTSADDKVKSSFTVDVTGVTIVSSVSINGYSNGGTINLEKGKTLNLTASVAPAGNTVTWSTSSANNVSLSARIGTNVTLTANSVTSEPVTITAKEAYSSQTFTLKVNVIAKQYLTLYFQAQTNWPADNVKVHYQTTNDTDWADINMTQMDGSCNSYAYAKIPLTGSNAIDSTSQFGFKYIRGDTSKWYGASGSPDSVPKEGNNFKFTNGSELPDVVVISAGPSYSITAPSGCAVTSTAACSSRRVAARSNEHRAVAAVLRTQGSVLAVANESNDTKADEDTAAGKFKVSDLAGGTYHLQEKTAPNGYEVSNTVYTITIANGSAIWNPAFGPDNADNKIANTRKTGAVTWTKVSSDTNNSEPLSGSEWTLKQTKAFSWADGAAKYADVTPATTLGTVTDCVDEQNGVAKCSTQTGVYVDLNGDSGKFKISGLGWGEYELVESKAPDGYDLDNTPHKFRIGPLEGGNIAGNWYANTDFNTEGTSAYNEQTTFTVNGGAIKNKPGVILPGTGGAGDYWIYAAALVAALIGVVAAGMALKVRRRQ